MNNVICRTYKAFKDRGEPFFYNIYGSKKCYSAFGGAILFYLNQVFQQGMSQILRKGKIDLTMLTSKNVSIYKECCTILTDFYLENLDLNLIENIIWNWMEKYGAKEDLNSFLQDLDRLGLGEYNKEVEVYILGKIEEQNKLISKKRGVTIQGNNRNSSFRDRMKNIATRFGIGVATAGIAIGTMGCGAHTEPKNPNTKEETQENKVYYVKIGEEDIIRAYTREWEGKQLKSGNYQFEIIGGKSNPLRRNM